MENLYTFTKGKPISRKRLQTASVLLNAIYSDTFSRAMMSLKTINYKKSLQNVPLYKYSP